MPNFYIPPNCINNDHIVFPPDELHHLIHVTRHSVNDTIDVVDGEGYHYQVKITEISKKSGKGVILTKERSKIESNIQVSLAQSLPKGKKLEEIIEKNTEIGVYEFYPVISERSISRPDNPHDKVTRWQKIALAAMKQSGRAKLPLVHPITEFIPFKTNVKNFDTVLFIWEKATMPIRDVNLENSRNVLIIIGPEGGFSEHEAKIANSENVNMVSLGKRILRTETAGLIAASWILLSQD